MNNLNILDVCTRIDTKTFNQIAKMTIEFDVESVVHDIDHNGGPIVAEQFLTKILSHYRLSKSKRNPGMSILNVDVPLSIVKYKISSNFNKELLTQRFQILSIENDVVEIIVPMRTQLFETINIEKELFKEFEDDDLDIILYQICSHMPTDSSNMFYSYRYEGITKTFRDTCGLVKLIIPK